MIRGKTGLARLVRSKSWDKPASENQQCPCPPLVMYNGLAIAGCSDRRKKMCICFVFRVCSVQQQSYSHTKCNALQDPCPCLRRCLRSKIIASQSVVWYTYTPIKKERKKEKAFGADQFAVVCPDLLGCLGTIVFQSLRCFQSKKSRPCWHRRWWPGQLGVQRRRREQRRWSRCRRSSPAFRRPAPRWS